MNRHRGEAANRRARWVSLSLFAAAASLAGPAFSSEPHPLEDLRFACETGDGAACNALGRTYETKKDLWGAPVRGGGVRRKDATAARYYQRACGLGDSDGCQRLGQMYEFGKGVARNDVEAQRNYLRACRLLNEDWCGARPVRLRD